VPWPRLIRVESTCTSYRNRYTEVERAVAKRTITRPFPRAADQPYPCPMSSERRSAQRLHDRAPHHARHVSCRYGDGLGWENRHIRITNVSPRSWAGPQTLSFRLHMRRARPPRTRLHRSTLGKKRSKDVHVKPKSRKVEGPMEACPSSRRSRYCT
jgi:hypothetical protein